MSAADSWRSSRVKRLQARLLSTAGYPIIGALASTYRWRQDGVHHLDEVARSGRQPIMAFWHGRILPSTYFFRRRGIVVITSENFDGEWIAGIIERFGYGTARGSTSRGAVKALVRMKREMGAGKPAAFTLDGPRGPAKVAQPGAIWLAKATGSPVVPFHIEARRHWTLRSWDRTQIPKPFSDVAIAIGEPIEVPPGADEAAMEQARQILEARLEALERRALAMI
jgi:lysophospholipid acyltransferase (LPLAT)-like uncharacterized protein